MNDFQTGDLITFRLRGEMFGLAQIIYIENLALYDHYHLAIRDAVLEGGPGGIDEYGEPYDRAHDFTGIEDAPVVVDHFALTYEAFLASEPMIVGDEEVEDEDLDGYRLFLYLMREDAVRRGMLRGNEETDEEDVDEEIENVDEEVEDEEPLDDITQRVEAHTWHMKIFDHPVGEVLFELHEIFAGVKFKEAQLGGFINSFFDGSSTEHIEELVTRFIDGDYGAGHELLVYGDVAADALSRHLIDDISPELGDDILRILCDTGSSKAYEHIASFFAAHCEHLSDPLHLPAARGYCYAVMVTGGTSEPLKKLLPRLNLITDPELSDDVRMAREAVENAPEEQRPITRETSADPFSSLGG